MTMHSAFWGIFFNLGLAIIVSAVTQKKAEMEHRMTFHNFLHEHAGLPADKRPLIPVAWIITILWFFFGIGPGHRDRREPEHDERTERDARENQAITLAHVVHPGQGEERRAPRRAGQQ